MTACPRTGRSIGGRCVRCGAGVGAPWWCGARALAEGDTVDGDAPSPSAARFRGLVVRGVLGHGGGGVVYRAWDAERGEEVALKTLATGGWATPAQRTRFRREISALRVLDDPGVIEVIDDGVAADGTPWFTMRLVEGPSLADLLVDATSPPLAERVRLVEEVARTLGRLHARGVFHRDVKPSNVLVDTDGRAILTDFGLVLAPEDERVTRATRAVGTPRYMAPELASGEVRDWARVDVHALGRVLQDVLGDDGSSRLRRIAERATSVDPWERHPDATHVADELARWRAGRGPGIAASIWAVGRRVRAARAPLAVVAVVVIALALAWLDVHWSGWRREAEAARAWSVAREEVLTQWGAGHPEEALSRFGRFADDPDHAGTATLVEAWLERARLHRTAGDVDAEVLAEQAALHAGADPTLRARALGALVGTYRTEQRWGPLAALLETVPADADVPGLAAARVDVALATGDAASALPGLAPGAAALVAPLAAATPLEGDVVRLLDEPGAVVRVDAAVAAPTRDGRGWRVPTGTRLADRSRLASWSADDGLHVARLGDDGIDVLHVGPARPVVALAWADGHAFVAVGGMERRLLVVRDGVLVDADPTFAALDSRIEGLTAADLDGDGRDELIALLGGPSAFALRVAHVDGERVIPAATRRVGPADLVGVLPGPGGARVLLGRRPTSPTAEPFGADPFGGTCALVALRLAGDRWEVTDEVPHRSPTPRCARASGAVGDLDGDGLVDLALGLEPTEPGAPPELWLYRQQGDGRLAEPVRVGGLRPLGTAPGARADVLLVARPDGTAWVAGEGAAPIPPVGLAPPVPPPTGDGAPPAHVEVEDNTVAWAVSGGPGEYLGQALAGVGDVDGDGYDDVVVCGYGFDGFRGRVHLYRGSATGLSTLPALTLAGSAPGQQHGLAIDGGDLDGDGFDDLVVASAPQGGAGEVAIHLGGVGGPDEVADLVIRDAWGAGPYGGFVVVVGDVDGDGREDLVIGASGAGATRGTARLHLGAPGGVATEPAWVHTAEAPGSLAGRVAGVGDVDGDGRADVAVVAPGIGRVEIFRGTGTGLSPNPSTVLEGDRRGAFGLALAGAGDVDGDGFDDVVVGSPGADAERGEVRLYRGGPHGLATTPAGVLRGEAAAARLGAALAGVGDVNRDGYDDVVVGAYGFSRRKGHALLFHGGPTGLDRTPAAVHGPPVQSDYGFAVAAAGDVDRDGFPDWLVGAPLRDHFHGEAQLFLGFDDRDRDGDGFVDRVDCVDDDPAISPSATEVCNGVDDDCDGRVDDDEIVSPLVGVSSFPDRDHDGFGDAAGVTRTCRLAEGRVLRDGDCDDARADVHPGAPELPNGRDDDCDGRTDALARR